MTITLRGVDLGFMGLDLSLLSDRSENVGVAYQCPAIAYIVETPQGRILWETGISANASEEWLPEWLEAVSLDALTPEAFIERRLAEMGLGPDDFRCVVLGHLHTDHAGGLRLFEDAGAEIVVHEREYAHVMGMQGSGDFLNQADWTFLGPKKPTLITGETADLADGISLVHLPGHTPGQMALQVQLENTGTVLLTSDALYLHDNYVSDAAPQIFRDVDQWRSSLGKIRKLAQVNEAWLFPGHDDTGIAHFDGKQELRAIEFARDHVYA